MRLKQVAARAKNRIGLEVDDVVVVGPEAGDLVYVADDQDRVITTRELSDRRRTYTMSDLLGAAAGLYDSVDDIDAEIAAGRID